MYVGWQGIQNHYNYFRLPPPVGPVQKWNHDVHPALSRRYLPGSDLIAMVETYIWNRAKLVGLNLVLHINFSMEKVAPTWTASSY
jgi:hypothetical protein